MWFTSLGPFLTNNVVVKCDKRMWEDNKRKNHENGDCKKIRMAEKQ